MHRLFRWAKGMVRQSIERDRSSERYVEAMSRALWPWQESRLLFIVGLLALLDFASTYAVLELSGRADVYEGGLLADWALQMGGFFRLFWVDIFAISALLLAAVAIRLLHVKFGFKGFGRAAFVVLLVHIL